MASLTGGADVDNPCMQKKLEATLREMPNCPLGMAHVVPLGGSPQ